MSLVDDLKTCFSGSAISMLILFAYEWSNLSFQQLFYPFVDTPSFIFTILFCDSTEVDAKSMNLLCTITYGLLSTSLYQLSLRKHYDS